jgi:hypothetical protein
MGIHRSPPTDHKFEGHTMSTLDTQYNEIMAAAKATNASDNQKHVAAGVIPAFGVNWSLHRYQCDDRPYVKASCSRCRTMYTTEALHFVFKHCGEQEAMPIELRDRLEALQIKFGIRVQTFVDELLGKSRPAPVQKAPATPSLASF